MVTRWLGTWPASKAKTCTWLIGFLALAGGAAVVEPPLRAAQARRYRGSQGLKKCLARACGLEGLVKILRRGEINPALFDQLRARLVSESVPHYAYDLLLGKRLPWARGNAGTGSGIVRCIGIEVSMP
jgi:hypothetical protein